MKEINFETSMEQLEKIVQELESMQRIVFALMKKGFLLRVMIRTPNGM